MQEAVIVSASRTPVGRAHKGSFATFRPDDLAAISMKETLKRANYKGKVDDVIIGCAMPEAEQGMNMARQITALAGLDSDVSAITINRYCASGLQSIAYAAHQIMVGQSDVIIAGGAESMSLIPMGGHTFRPNPTLIENAHQYYMTMGHTAEKVANKYDVSREDQDTFAVQSHKRAAEALHQGRFKDEIAPVEMTLKILDNNEQMIEKKLSIHQDEGVRPDTNLDVLATLRPAFAKGGTVTAGNSSQMSDGAATVLLMSADKAKREGLKPIAKLRGFAVAGVDPDIMGIGPVKAIPKALKQARLQLEDIGLIELNEAFAAQAVAVIRNLGLDEKKVNVNGGAIALGHPLGCTGTKLTVSLLHEMKRRNVQFGLVTMCVGGGMGAAGVFELL